MSPGQQAVADAQMLANALPALLESLGSMLVDVEQRMAELDAAGLIYAAEHWRKDANGEPKYFYLNYPTQAGEKRRREYVGSDPERIQAAQAGIDRASQYEALRSEQTRINGQIQHAAGTIRQARDLMQSSRVGRRAITEWV